VFVKGGPLPVWSAFADASTKVGTPCTCRVVGRLRTGRGPLGGHGRLIDYRTTGAALRSEVTFRSQVGIERATSPSTPGTASSTADPTRARLPGPDSHHSTRRAAGPDLRSAGAQAGSSATLPPANQAFWGSNQDHQTRWSLFSSMPFPSGPNIRGCNRELAIPR
jgi:hypothetical protein